MSSRAIYERWLEADVFAPDGKGNRADWSRKPFVITQPPPNITGALHIGHALTFDARGRDDPARADAGLSDVVGARRGPRFDRRSGGARPNRSPRKARRRASLGRERYLERMWQFINETRETMIGEQHTSGR